jgi:hypothetical protein
LPFLFTVFFSLATASSTFAADMPRKHSLAECAYLVGTWRCTATSPGRKPLTYTTSIRWKTFMTPDAPYRNAVKTCKVHNRMFIVCLLPVFASRDGSIQASECYA